MSCNSQDQVVLADAGLFGSIPYWYCRKCKVELGESGFEVFSKKDEGEELLGFSEEFPRTRRDSDPYKKAFIPQVPKNSDIDDLFLDYEMFEDDGGSSTD